MLLASHKILLDPVDFEPIYTLVTNYPEEAIKMLEADKDIEFTVRGTKEIGWYSIRGIHAISLHVTKGARKIFNQYPPMKPQVDEEWGYKSALDKLP